MLLKNALILNDNWEFIKGDIRVVGEKIAEIGELSANVGEEEIDCKGNYIIPGLVETHFHGAMGEDSDALTDNTFDTFSRYFATQGITTFVPGLSSNKDQTVEEFLIKSAQYIKTVPNGAKMGGVYLEGPFISYKNVAAIIPKCFKSRLRKSLRDGRRYRDAL